MSKLIFNSKIETRLKLFRLHRSRKILTISVRYNEEVTATHYGFTSTENVIRKALSGIAKVRRMINIVSQLPRFHVPY